MQKENITFNRSGTTNLGKKLASEILENGPQKKAIVVGLEGELGAGKTAFLQGFGKRIGVKENILSPTFLILKRFGISATGFKNFFHIDCYRIEKPEEIKKLNISAILSNPQNIVAIEWVDKIKKILPKKIIFVKFKIINKNKRKITVGY